MKSRSLTAVLTLAVVAGAAVAGETVCLASGEAAAAGFSRVHPAHQALGVSPHALTDVDVARLTRSSVGMPTCSSCH
ncbi:MAG TPA: hypothetical protein VFW82_05690 [Dyella sp.]|nr:hypothetical protein [Dyella sp.]